MAVTKFSFIVALLPHIKEDPLPQKERMQRNMMMLHLLEPCKISKTALDYLMHFRSVLDTCTPAMLVSMFPEKEFNALALIEYLLNYVKVFMDDPKDFMSDVSDVMEDWNSTISALKELLEWSSLLDEEQALRVENCYRDIANAAQHCNQIGESSDDTEAEDFNFWPPFFTTKFPSDNEKNFMTELYEIYKTAETLPTGEIFLRLEELCKSTDLSHVTSSDIQSNSAMRLMSSIVEQAIDFNCCDELNWERYTFLMSSFATLNNSSLPQMTVSICFRRMVFSRLQRAQALLERAHNIFCAPPVNEMPVDFRTTRGSG